MKIVIITFIILLVGGNALAWGVPYGNNYYNPLNNNFILNPSAYMGSACVTCSLPSQSQMQRNDITKQQVIPVYSGSGQLEGKIVHGIYEPNAAPTPPRSYGQTERSYSVMPSNDQQHPNWHIIQHQ